MMAARFESRISRARTQPAEEHQLLRCRTTERSFVTSLSFLLPLRRCYRGGLISRQGRFPKSIVSQRHQPLLVRSVASADTQARA
jgi:hypothetical protein